MNSFLKPIISMNAACPLIVYSFGIGVVLGGICSKVGFVKVTSRQRTRRRILKLMIWILYHFFNLRYYMHIDKEYKRKCWLRFWIRLRCRSRFFSQDIFFCLTLLSLITISDWCFLTKDLSKGCIRAWFSVNVIEKIWLKIIISNKL